MQQINNSAQNIGEGNYMFRKAEKLTITFMALFVFMFMFVAVGAYAEERSFSIWNGSKYVTVKASSGTNTTNCWEYANSIYKMIWGVEFCSGRWGYQAKDHNILVYLTDEQRTITEDHVREFISSGCTVLGSVIRVQACPLDCPGISSDQCGRHGGVSGHNHSMILVAKSSTGFTVLEARSDGRKTTDFTWKSFTDRFASGYVYFKYIKSPNSTDYTPYQASTLEFRNVRYPATYKRNTSPGWNLGSGSLDSNVNLVSIRSVLSKNDGTWTQDTGEIQISGKTYAISKINSKVKYSQFPSAGNYTWSLTGKDESGRTLTLAMPVTAVDSGSTVEKTTSKTYQEQPSTIPVQSLSMNGNTYMIDYLSKGSSYSSLPTVYPSNATNKKIVFPEFSDGVISVDSSGTVRAIGSGWSGFVVYAEDNPDAKFVYNFVVYDYDSGNPPAWHPDNLKVKKDGTIAFDIITDGSGTFNHFVLRLPKCKKTSGKSLQTGVVIGGTDNDIDIYTEDDNNLIRPGKLAHIEIQPVSLDPYWGTTQSYELQGGFLIGYYSVFPSTGLLIIKQQNIPIAAVLPEIPSDFTTPSSLKTIGDEAFRGIAAKYVRIANKVTRIDSNAFAYCGNLSCVLIPESCTTIASNAFVGDSGLIIYGKSGSYAESYASGKGFTFKAVLTRSQKIQQYIMASGDYKTYEADFDLDDNGVINTADYIQAKKAE